MNTLIEDACKCNYEQQFLEKHFQEETVILHSSINENFITA